MGEYDYNDDCENCDDDDDGDADIWQIQISREVMMVGLIMMTMEVMMVVLISNCQGGANKFIWIEQSDNFFEGSYLALHKFSLSFQS